MLTEYFGWHAHAHVDKWQSETIKQIRGDLGLTAPTKDELFALGIQPDLTADVAGNLITTAGATRLLNLLIAAGGQAFDHTHCRLGVGDSNTAATVADTDLGASAGSTHRWFNMADSTYPLVSTNVMTIVSTFASGDGNFVWQEWGVDAGTSASAVVAAPLLNHKIASLGTKVSGAIWAITATFTVA